MPFYGRHVRIGLILLLGVLTIVASVVLIRIQQERSANRLYLSFDGTLRGADGLSPNQITPSEFSSYLHRQVLHLEAGEKIQYDIQKLSLKRGALSFWVKPDLLPPEEPVTFLSLSNADQSLSFELSWKRKTIQLLTPQALYKVTHSSFSIGAWTYVSIVWDEKSVFHFYLDGSELPLQQVNGKRHLQTTSPGKLTISCHTENDEPFGIRFRDLAFNETYTNQTPDLREEQKTEWRAIDLPHYAGKKIAAWGASRQEAWTGDSLMAETDPIRLPSQGEYLLQWHIKPIGQIDPGMIESRVSSASEVLGSHANAQGEFSNKIFQDWILPFTAPGAISVVCQLRSYAPLKYAFLVDGVTVKSPGAGWGKHFHIEDVHVHMGAYKAETDAERGKAVDNENTLTFGPYSCIGQPGIYRATWRIKISKSIPEKTPLLFLDIFAHDGFLTNSKRGNKSYGELALNTESFTKRETWEEKSIEFFYDGADMMEFRTFTRNFQPGAVVVDTITVSKTH